MANERRLIDANGLKRLVKEFRDEAPHATARKHACNVILSMLGNENQTPTVEAIEACFCKDCEHYEDNICNFYSEWPDQYSTGHTTYMEPDDFCSYGKKREVE